MNLSEQSEILNISISSNAAEDETSRTWRHERAVNHAAQMVYGCCDDGAELSTECDDDLSMILIDCRIAVQAAAAVDADACGFRRLVERPSQFVDGHAIASVFTSV